MRIIAFDKPRRFFYHFHKAKGLMSVHFAGACHTASNVVCDVPCQTKWSRRQPKLVMQGFAKRLTIFADGGAVISDSPLV